MAVMRTGYLKRLTMDANTREVLIIFLLIAFVAFMIFIFKAQIITLLGLIPINAIATFGAFVLISIVIKMLG